MSNSLHFKIKDNIDSEKHHLVELFFKAWVDYNCNKQVQYQFVHSHRIAETDIFRADFDQPEDAVLVKLKGIPVEYREYLEIVEDYVQ